MNTKITCLDINGGEHIVPLSELTFRPSVYGVILKEGKVLLSKQWDGYDFPGGGVNLGETLDEALVREVKEETGLDIKKKQILHGQSTFFKFSTGQHVQGIQMFFLCEVLSGEVSTEFLDEEEKAYVEKPEWIDVTKVSALKFYNSADSPTIIAEAVKLYNKS